LAASADRWQVGLPLIWAPQSRKGVCDALCISGGMGIVPLVERD